MLFGCGAAPKDLELVADTGFDYAELPCRQVTAMEEDEFRSLCRRVERSPVPVLAMNIYCPPEVVIVGPGYRLDTARDYAQKAAERAAALGVRWVGIGSPRSRILPEGFDPALADKQVKEFLTATADVFGRSGIAVGFEALGPCFCNFVNTLQEVVDIVRSVGHPNLGVVLDFYNMEHSGEADMDFSQWLPWIWHAHISDDDGAPTMRSYLHPDKADLHRRRLNGLRDGGYDRMLTLEMDVGVDVARAKESLAVMKAPWVSP